MKKIILSVLVVICFTTPLLACWGLGMAFGIANGILIALISIFLNLVAHQIMKKYFPDFYQDG